MSVMTNSTVQTCHQKAMGSKTMERRVSTVILNVYHSTGIEKEDDSRQSLENHGKLDEIRRFHNKKFEEGHDVHRNLALAEGYSRPNKKGEYQYVSGVMGIAYNPFLNSEAANLIPFMSKSPSFFFSTQPLYLLKTSLSTHPLPNPLCIPLYSLSHFPGNSKILPFYNWTFHKQFPWQHPNFWWNKQSHNTTTTNTIHSHPNYSSIIINKNVNKSTNYCTYFRLHPITSSIIYINRIINLY